MTDEKLSLRTTARGVTVEVEVKVRASRTRVLGVRGGRLSVALAAPPVDGAANEALRRALADHFDVPVSAVRIAMGEKQRKKVVELGGVSEAYVLERVPSSS